MMPEDRFQNLADHVDDIGHEMAPALLDELIREKAPDILAGLFTLQLLAAEERAAGRPVRLSGEQLRQFDEQTERLGQLLEVVREW